MNEKLKISLFSVGSFGLGAATFAGFLAWTVKSTLKEMNNNDPYRFRRYTEKQKDCASSETTK